MQGLRSGLFVMLACLILIAGCTSPGGNSPGGAGTVPTSEPTPLPGTAPLPPPVTTPYETIPVTYITPVYPVYTPPAYVTPYQTPGSAPVPPAVAEPSNPADIVFTRYTDPYFGIDYPSAWKVTQSSHVTFTSASGRVTFTAEVDNFPSGLSGNYRLNPDISAIQDLVSREFPGYAPANIIANYQTTMLNGVPATIYSVRIPDGSVAYTRYMFVTVRHAYRFTFIADSATFDELAPLRNYMFGTLTLNDQA